MVSVRVGVMEFHCFSYGHRLFLYQSITTTKLGMMHDRRRYVSAIWCITTLMCVVLVMESVTFNHGKLWALITNALTGNVHSSLDDRNIDAKKLILHNGYVSLHPKSDCLEIERKRHAIK